MIVAPTFTSISNLPAGKGIKVSSAVFEAEEVEYESSEIEDWCVNVRESSCVFSKSYKGNTLTWLYIIDGEMNKVTNKILEMG